MTFLAEVINLKPALISKHSKRDHRQLYFFGSDVNKTVI